MTTEETLSFISGSTATESSSRTTSSSSTSINDHNDHAAAVAHSHSMDSSMLSYDDLTYSTCSGVNTPASLVGLSSPSEQRVHTYYQHRHHTNSNNRSARQTATGGVAETTFDTNTTTTTTISSTSHNPYQTYQSTSSQQYYQSIGMVRPSSQQSLHEEDDQASTNVYRPRRMIDHIIQPRQGSDAAAAGRAEGGGLEETSSSSDQSQTLLRCLASPRVILTFAVCFIIVGNLIAGSQFLEHAWELGVSGLSAQRRANRVQQKIFAPVLRLSHSPKLIEPTEPEAMTSQNDKHLLLDASSNQEQYGCESTIMLIRHCEKGSLKSHCSFLGYERSVYLAEQFGMNTTDRWPAPSQIYAMKAGGRKHGNVNYREVETVEPLSRKVGVPINSEYSVKHTSQLAMKLLGQILDGEMCGKVVVVSWKHSDIARLAQHLGCGPLEGCPWDYRGKDFDTVWQIRYAYAAFYDSRTEQSTYKWNVYGSVQDESFDPLQFSHRVGDYPPGGTRDGTLAHFEKGDFKLYG
mmetsp:Transcript_57840/g.141311  ORF Transcript_57840/g.141311 Transcript_57840/m.141311 type:complete len:520 (+) Transcript_57840:343-1902(+)